MHQHKTLGKGSSGFILFYVFILNENKNIVAHIVPQKNISLDIIRFISDSKNINKYQTWVMVNRIKN
jgi:hypothetical protein